MRQNISDGPISRRRAIALATYAVVGAGVLWRVARYLANWPLWGDEAYIAVSLLTRDFLGLTKPLEYYQIAPPGFLWAELVSIRSFGASELALRLLPFACGIASLFLFCRLASTVLDRRSALMAIAFFAVSFYPVRHANEVKPYSSDLLLALVIIDLAVLAWNRPDSKRMWGLMTLVSAVGVWVSYPLILVSTGIGVVLGVRAWLRRSRSWAPGGAGGLF
jgi:4-amino-4-deoxy-L-arabinose transferase-like glycosyltransferase